MSTIVVRFAELEDFLAELGPHKRHLTDPVRIATVDHQPPPGSEAGAIWVTKVGALVNGQLLEATLISAGEASAEQAVKQVEGQLGDLEIEVAVGSQYTVG